MSLPRASPESPVAAISRNVTACAACRKQKIKCRMRNSKPPCTRCQKRDLSCVVRKTKATLVEVDVSWKDSIEARLQHMEGMIKSSSQATTLGGGQSVPQTQALMGDGAMEAQDQAIILSERAHEPSLQPWQVVLDHSEGPGAIPASSLSKATSSLSASRPDLAIGHYPAIISNGTVSLAAAEGYFDLYRQRLDPAVYHILAEHASFAGICASSPLLVTVICTVAALHYASPDYEACYRVFRDEFAAQQLSKEHSFDDVRALCIGAFYLSDLSWNLVGAAVRIASEINLHRCITKIPHVKEKCYVRTRLYFLVYVCDHQFSVAYGRPPMTREFNSLSSPVAFLDSSVASQKDARLISQVEIWSINGRIFDTFGVDTEKSIPEKHLPQMRRLNIALDMWRADWSDRLHLSASTDNHPNTDIALHFHFAKLYLCSHVFRRPQPEAASHTLSSEMGEYANLAVYSASAIIRLVTVDEETCLLLPNLPTYFDTMLAFSAVFLLKLIRACPATVKIDKQETWDLVEQLVIVLRNITTGLHAQHLLFNIATSIESILHRIRRPQSAYSQPTSMIGATASQDWLMPSSDSMFLDNYDFFWPQDNDLDFEFSGTSNMQTSVS